MSFFTSRSPGLRPSKILVGGYISTNGNFLVSIHPWIYFKSTFYEPRIFFENIVDKFYGSGVNGNTPFYYLPALGGSERMRGYYEGRYRDNFYITGQFELYISDPWLNRTGFYIFAATGDVGNTMEDFYWKDFKMSYGLGLVYLLNPDNRTILRADFGFGPGTMGIYFAAGTAF